MSGSCAIDTKRAVSQKCRTPEGTKGASANRPREQDRLVGGAGHAKRPRMWKAKTLEIQKQAPEGTKEGASADRLVGCASAVAGLSRWNLGLRDFRML